MINAPDVLRDYLLAKAALTTLTGTRIWAERASPPRGYTPAQGGAIAFRARGGDVDYSGALLRNSWQFKCYGGDEAAANALYRTLFDVLHDGQGGGFLTAQLEGAGQTLYESYPPNDTGWPYVLCYYEIWMLAQAA